ncbi:MAG: metallophosphoesterase family protein [Anaerolineae bacterium]
MDAIILGGDIVGKMVVPIVARSDGTFVAEFLGEKKVVKENDPEGLEKLRWAIKNNGFYPYDIDEEEFDQIKNDDQRKAAIFEEAIIESLEGWVKIAEERLKGTGIQCFITPGNDDPLFIDEILSRSAVIVNPDEQCIKLGGRHEMISLGYANMTPWRCPRDLPEEELAGKLERLCAMVKDMSTCIFNLHCPPYNTILDTAPLLDETLKAVTVGGAILEANVGSTAVLDAIKKYQPLISLHGHIHESRGDCKIGRTVCINPGSEYSQGILRGVVVHLTGNKIKNYVLTSG